MIYRRFYSRHKMNEKYDNVLIGILQNEGQVAGFLDAILGFLYRRTDFYRIMKSNTDKMGFPPGTALNLLVNGFKKYEKLAVEDEKQRERKREQQTRKKEKIKEEALKEKLKVVSDTIPPPVFHQVEISSQSTVDNVNNKEQSRIVDNRTGNQENNRIEDKVVSKQSSDQSQVDGNKQGDTTDNQELIRQQAVFQSNPESYNGAMRDTYSWSQSITDLDIHVKIPKYIKKGKDLKVVIEKKHLFISYRDETGNFVEVMKGDICWEINKEESMWNLVPGEHILINLDKKQERWWEAVLTTEPKINVRKIDASRPMTDLDDEAQSKIEEMMFNERQKKMGLPQSHEKKVHDVLSQAWNVEGSPFKGTPFDSSKINVEQGGMISINDNNKSMQNS